MIQLALGVALASHPAISAQSTRSAPPERSNGEPSGTLPAGTTRTTLKLETKHNAVCRYATTAGTAYSAMKGIFDTHGTAHSVRINGLADGRRYSYYVRCESVSVAGSGVATNADDFAITFSVAAATGPTPTPDPTDTTKPTVVVTAPLNGAKVTGMVTIKASATDKTGIASVTFLVDGTAIGTATASPYSVRWDTSDLPPGPHTIRAQARDGAGNVNMSRDVSVTVTVSDDDEPVTPTSGRAIFEPPDRDTGVLRYELDIFRSGSDLKSPVATQNLGKPREVDGEISADISRTLASLPEGKYVATVTAVGSTERARSDPSPPFDVKSARKSSALMLSGADDSTGAAEDLPRAADVDAPGVSAAGRSSDTLWVTDASASLVTALDASTGDVLATVPVGLRPTGIVAPRGSDKVYVADEGSDSISVISKATMTVAATIPLPPPFGRQPHHMSASPDGRFVYVGERGSNVVNVIDTATDQISARFAAGWPGSRTLAVVPDPAGELLYALSAGTAPSRSTFTALDAGTGRVLWQLPIDDPGHFVLAPDGLSGVLSHGARPAVTVIDLAGQTVGNPIDLGGGAGVDDLQLSADGRSLVATLRPTGSLVIVNLTDTTSASAVPLRAVAGHTAPSAMEPIYVPVSGSGEFSAGVIVVDAATRRVVRQFRLPGQGTPHAAALDSPR